MGGWGLRWTGEGVEWVAMASTFYIYSYSCTYVTASMKIGFASKQIQMLVSSYKSRG